MKRKCPCCDGTGYVGWNIDHGPDFEKYRKNREYIYMLYEKGMTQAEIARKTGVSRQRINQIIKLKK